MSFEGIIATPFGYLIDVLYRLTSSYGISLVLFAVLVQMVMVPLSIVNRRNAEKKHRLKPLVHQIKLQYDDDPEKQISAIDELYKKERYSIVGSFVLTLLPIFILIPIFQVVAQPIIYMFHETPETASAIIAAMKEETPELFVSAYNQVTALPHIQGYADIIREKVPEVSQRTLEGMGYSFLGLDLSIVPGAHLLNKGSWAWDWPHIGALLLPIVYMARRIYVLIARIIRTYSSYFKAKKQAVAEGAPLPKLPNPPALALFFLLLSLTALFSLPIAMNLYWLVSGIAATGLNKLIAQKAKKKAAPAETAAADA